MEQKNQNGAGVGIILDNSKGVILEYSFRLDFNATNNMAEYEALLSVLKLAKAVGAEVLNVKSDSLLVVHQFAKIYEVKEPTLKKYFAEVTKWSAKFYEVQVEQIPRETNEEADYLERIASGDPEEGLYRLVSILELSRQPTRKRNRYKQLQW